MRIENYQEQMCRTFAKIVGLLIYTTGVICLVYLILSESFGDLILKMTSMPLLVYSVLLFVLSFAFLTIIRYKNRANTPSVVLFLFFLAVPIVGYISYEVFIDVHGNFFGKQLSFDYPLLLWSVGTAVFFGGVLLPQLLPSSRKRSCGGVWDLRRASFLLWIALGISIMASLVVIARIGYMPIFQPDINMLRGKYEIVAGRYAARFSRLFLVVCLLSTILFFLRKNKKLFLAILLGSSVLGLTLFGERLPLFWAICFFLLVYCKFYTPTRRQMLLLACLCCCVLFLFLMFAEHRAGRLNDRITLKERVLLPFLTEYSYYAYVIDDISRTGQYLEEDIFLGALVVLLPRQIWALFGIDKENIMEKHFAVHFFGEQFRDPMGTRITPIGEAYAAYGILNGVCIQMFLFGLIFGILERMYTHLDKRDTRLCIVSFILSLFMWLPIATLRAILNPLVLYGGPLLLCQLIATKRASKTHNLVHTS